MRGLVVMLFGTLLLTGCGQKGGGGGDLKFQLLWPDANGQYRLQEVAIETLASPNELRGEAAEVFSRASFNASGFNGSIARPHVTKSGDVYIPQDSESMTAISIYAQFDRLYKYEREVHGRAQLNWPRRVGIETAVAGPDTFQHNNAHFFTNLDVIGVVPFTRGGHVPVAMNHGILAHEHFHAHFQTQVLNVINRAKPQPIVSALEQIFYPFFFPNDMSAPKINPSSTRDLNNLVLRAWNEGLADLFAGIYKNQGDVFKPSLPGLSEARDLDQDPGKFWTAANLRGFAPGPLTNEQTSFVAYGQGATLARLMYSLANNGTEAPRVFMARVLERLSAIPRLVEQTMDARVMDFEELLPILLEGYKLNASACDSLNGALTSKRSFPTCAH